MNFQKVFISSAYKIVFLFLSITLFSCNLLNSDNENSSRINEPIPVPFDILRASPALEENGVIGGVFKCGFNLNNIERSIIKDKLSDVELIITNQAYFDKYIEGYEDPEVNFDEEFVLAGMTTVQPHCIYIKEQNVHLLCNTLTYTVVIGDMACALPEVALYVIVVSNKYLADFIEFKIIREEI